MQMIHIINKFIRLKIWKQAYVDDIVNCEL